MPDLEVEQSTESQEFEDYQKARTAKLPADAAEPAKEQPAQQDASAVPEAAEAAKTGAESETEQEEGEKAKGKGGFQRRIDKLTRQNYELKAKADEAQKRAEDLERLAKPAEQQKPADATSEPKLEQFDSVEKFLDARDKWKDTQAEAAAEQERSKAAYDTYNERLVTARAAHDDFDDVLEEVSASGFTIPNTAQVCIIEAENGPDIAYYLATHQDEAKKLMDMSAARVAVEIGRISARLETPPPSGSDARPPEKKPVTATPAPIRPVGGGTTKSSVPLGELSADEYMAQRRAGRTA